MMITVPADPEHRCAPRASAVTGPCRQLCETLPRCCNVRSVSLSGCSGPFPFAASLISLKESGVLARERPAGSPFMADATSKKLLALLDPEQPAALRRAAATVLGEVGSKDTAVGNALCGVLDDPDGELRIEATKAVGKLHIDKALPQLLSRA